MGMKIDFVIDEKDIVKEVHITASPIEYLIIGVALKQFIKNHNDIGDTEIAKQMIKVIENDCNSNTNQRKVGINEREKHIKVLENLLSHYKAREKCEGYYDSTLKDNVEALQYAISSLKADKDEFQKNGRG